MFDTESRQPVLTSHELTAQRVGPNRGKQRFDVHRTPNGQPSGRSRDNAQRPRPRPDFKPKAPRPPKPEGFSHEQMLQAYKGSTIILTLAGVEAGELVAKLIDSDRYTLMVETEYGRELIFKSALSSIVVQPKIEAA